jgi:uncharacterized protein YjbJ (UPF0337 family)
MNQEQFIDCWKQIQPALQKQWGDLTNEDLVQVAGDQAKFHSAIQRRYGARKDEVRLWADRWYAKWSGSYVGYKEVEAATPAS